MLDAYIIDRIRHKPKRPTQQPIPLRAPERPTTGPTPGKSPEKDSTVVDFRL